MKVLLIGNGAREHALAEAIARSACHPKIFAFMKSNNPGIADLAEKVKLGGFADLDFIVEFAKSCRADLAVIGPEDPLNHGVVDALRKAGIPSIGPSKTLARLETSKSFTRELLAKYGIRGNIKFKVFSALAGIAEFLEELDEAVIKPDGLTGGKGVLVQGEHFLTRQDAKEACRQILKEHRRLIIEEKLEGEEFSLQCLTDGMAVIAMPPVQDHKRRFPGDQGPNTGGMGSYSAADHSLPFLKGHEVAEGLAITKEVAAALREETGELYKGVMYGGFMTTKDGVKLLEYNARFGDPEAMNILPLLESDFLKLCEAVISGTLGREEIVFAKQATVCKYVVPKSYGLSGGHPEPGEAPDYRIDIGHTGSARIYFSSVDKRADGLYMTSSRAVGVVGIADTLKEAEKIAEEAAGRIKGWVDHRPDIGTAELIEKRIAHMEKLGKAH